ncbi:uncharacterized protein LOC141856444 [Brevipalpus obovatus]|uniref:uncharacterized protein LOC141856444 n=1 Tax=Brevipalpus obovatus TaxID=246614 RepID=UPI003D9F6122
MAKSGGDDVCDQRIDELKTFVIENDLILSEILNSFSAAHLWRSRLVCKRWPKIARQLIQDRPGEVIFILQYTEKFWKNYIPRPRGKFVDKAQQFLVSLVNKTTNLMRTPNADREHVTHLLSDYILNEMRCLPKFCIFFTTNSKTADELGQKSVVPNISQLAILTSSGLIATQKLGKNLWEIESSSGYNVNAMAGCIFSDRYDDYKITVTSWSPNGCEEPNLKDPEYPAKCILLFSADLPRSPQLQEFLRKIPSHIALGGGSVYSINSPQLVNEKNDNSYCRHPTSIVFAGKNIQAASLVVMDKFDRNETIEKLKQFRHSLPFDVDQYDSRAHTMGFLFICNGKGRFFYRNKFNVEADAIFKIFPRVNFTGAYVAGEFGHTYVESESQKECDDACKALHHLTYSTVIVLIHFSRKSG